MKIGFISCEQEKVEAPLYSCLEVEEFRKNLF